MAKARIEFCGPNRVRPQGFDLFRKSLVQTLNDRHHEDDCDYADTDTEYRQRRAQLISAQRIERHIGRFCDVYESHDISDCRFPIEGLAAIQWPIADFLTTIQ